jgi:hypothetical protein
MSIVIFRSFNEEDGKYNYFNNGKYYKTDKFKKPVSADCFDWSKAEQATGIKDSNCKMIYENDTLKGISNNVFSMGGMSFRRVIWGRDSWHIEDSYFSLQEFFNNCSKVTIFNRK